MLFCCAEDSILGETFCAELQAVLKKASSIKIRLLFIGWRLWVKSLSLFECPGNGTKNAGAIQMVLKLAEIPLGVSACQLLGLLHAGQMVAVFPGDQVQKLA